MRVAYEHVRLVPSKDLAKDITESYIEDDIADTKTDELKKIGQETESKVRTCTKIVLAPKVTSMRTKNSDRHA